MKFIDETYGFFAAVIPALFICLAADAAATEMVFVPINPAFGGSPMNASALLNVAQVTKKHKEPKNISDSGFSRQTSLQQFNDMLERSILSQLSSAATSGIMGEHGTLTPGTVQTGNFRIDIVDAGGGLLQITTTDKVTGGSTSFQVGQ